MGLWEDSVEAGISRLGKESGPRGLYRRGGSVSDQRMDMDWLGLPGCGLG